MLAGFVKDSCLGERDVKPCEFRTWGMLLLPLTGLAMLWLNLEASLFPVSVHCLMPSGTEWLAVCGLRCSERSAKWVRAKLLGLSQVSTVLARSQGLESARGCGRMRSAWIASTRSWA